MNLRTVATALVVLSCIASVGVASTTLETSLSTNPDEVVDLNYDTVPISPDTAGDLKRAMTGQGSEASVQRSANGDGEGQPRVGAAEEERRSSDSSAGGQANEQRSQSRSESDGTEATDATREWLDVFMDFLETFLPLFVALAVLLGVAVLLARYGDGLARRLDGDADRGAPAGSPELEPRNAVERTWASVLAAADVEDPWRRTPEECASAAVESGFDPEGVERLRRVFEEVRYGDREVTDARVRRMEEGLSQFDEGRRPEGVRR